MSFSWRKKGSFSYLVFPPWEASGLCHGFVGNSANFSTAMLSEFEEQFKTTFEVSTLLLPKQTHGIDIIELCNTRDNGAYGRSALEGDGLFAKIDSRASSKVALGIRTADCLPILIKSTSHFALVHAGWRGLASGIIENAITAFKSLDAMRKLQMLIGPAACGKCYEVGEDVISALGSRAVYTKITSQKSLVSLVGTAKHIIEGLAPEALIVSSDTCTICSNKFHSFRRDRERMGSNLAFMVI